MTKLKSYSSFKGFKNRKDKKKDKKLFGKSGRKDLVSGGVTAFLGIALLDQTAGAVASL